MIVSVYKSEMSAKTREIYEVLEGNLKKAGGGTLNIFSLSRRDENK